MANRRTRKPAVEVRTATLPVSTWSQIAECVRRGDRVASMMFAELALGPIDAAVKGRPLDWSARVSLETQSMTFIIDVLDRLVFVLKDWRATEPALALVVALSREEFRRKDRSEAEAYEDEEGECHAQAG